MVDLYKCLFLLKTIDYSAVSQARSRLQKKLKDDHNLRVKFDKINKQLSDLFAVGMPITRHPPYRSQRALLMHWVPASGNDAQSY